MSNIKGLYIQFLIATIFTLNSQLLTLNSTFAYEYAGIRWSDTDVPIGYYVNENTEDTTDEGLACQAAAQTWNDVSASYFEFRYLGPTTRPAPSFDGDNVLSWGSTAGSVATTYIWYIGETIIECDLVFEDLYDWGTTGASDLMDVQDIAIHEFGHFLLLLDLYDSADSEKTMYGYVGYGETKKRTLGPDDIAGISFIYPSTSGRTITADFTAGPIKGILPLAVQFTDLSAGDITGWLWDFGDGSPTDTSQNPSHTYTNPGRYTVTLEVTGPFGFNTVINTDYIVVQPSFTIISPNVGPIGTQITIYGRDFGASHESGYVLFRKRKKAIIISWSDDTIECIIPRGARSGHVEVRNNYRTKGRAYFTVTRNRLTFLKNGGI